MVELDDKDIRLLQALSENGRANWSELEDNVGLTGASIKKRYERLNELGVIQSVGIEMDRDLIDDFTPVLLRARPSPDEYPRLVESLRESDYVNEIFELVSYEIVAELRVPDSNISAFINDEIGLGHTDVKIDIIEEHHASAGLPESVHKNYTGAVDQNSDIKQGKVSD